MTRTHPWPPPALGRRQRDSATSAYPSEPPLIAPDENHKYIPKNCCASSQSPGLNLLFDRNIAYLTAEQEYSLMMCMNSREANLQYSTAIPLTEGPFTLISFWFGRLNPVVLPDLLAFLQSAGFNSSKQSQVDDYSASAISVAQEVPSTETSSFTV